MKTAYPDTNNCNCRLHLIQIWAPQLIEASQRWSQKGVMLSLWKSKTTNLLEWIYSISLTKPAWDPTTRHVVPYTWIIPASLSGLVQK